MQHVLYLDQVGHLGASDFIDDLVSTCHWQRETPEAFFVPAKC